MLAGQYIQRSGTGSSWTGLDVVASGGETASCAFDGEGNTAIVEATKFGAPQPTAVNKVTFRVIGAQPPGSNDSEYFLLPGGEQLSSEGGGVFSAMAKDVPSLTPANVASDVFGIAWSGYAMNGGAFSIARVELEVS